MERIICKWWKLTHNRLPLRYNGTHSLLTYECTRPTWCSHNTADERLGGYTVGGLPVVPILLIAGALMLMRRR